MIRIILWTLVLSIAPTLTAYSLDWRECFAIFTGKPDFLKIEMGLQNEFQRKSLQYLRQNQLWRSSYLSLLNSIENEQDARAFRAWIDAKLNQKFYDYYKIHRGKGLSVQDSIIALLEQGANSGPYYELVPLITTQERAALFRALLKSRAQLPILSYVAHLNNPSEILIAQQAIEQGTLNIAEIKQKILRAEITQDISDGLFSLESWEGGNPELRKVLTDLFERYQEKQSLFEAGYQIAKNITNQYYSKRTIPGSKDTVTTQARFEVHEAAKIPGKIKVLIPWIKVERSGLKAGENPIRTGMSNIITVTLIAALKYASLRNAIEIEVVGQNIVNRELHHQLRVLGFHKRTLNAARDYTEPYQIAGNFDTHTFHRKDPKIDLKERTFKAMRLLGRDIKPSLDSINQFSNPYSFHAVSVLLARDLSVADHVKALTMVDTPERFKAFEILVDTGRNPTASLEHFGQITHWHQTHALSYYSQGPDRVIDLMPRIGEIRSFSQAEAFRPLGLRDEKVLPSFDQLLRIENRFQVSALEALCKKRYPTTEDFDRIVTIKSKGDLKKYLGQL